MKGSQWVVGREHKRAFQPKKDSEVFHFQFLIYVFTLMETTNYWRADKFLGCMDQNPFWLVERNFSLFQKLFFGAVDFQISSHQNQINIGNK